MPSYYKIKSLSCYKPKEKLFLKQWVNGKTFHKKLRDSYLNSYQDDNKDTLENMLSLYDSGYNKEEKIYRGIRFLQKDKNKALVYQKIKNNLEKALEGKYLISIDFAPSSFSHSLSIAQRFASIDDRDYFSVIFMVKERFSNEIDVCSKEVAYKASYRNEKEIILKTDRVYFLILEILEENNILFVILKEVV